MATRASTPLFSGIAPLTDQMNRIAQCKHMHENSYAPWAYALMLCGIFRTKDNVPVPASLAVTILDQSAPIVWC